MFYAVDYYLGPEVAYRRERIARDWKLANARRRDRETRRRNLRLPKLPHLRLPRRRPGISAVA